MVDRAKMTAQLLLHEGEKLCPYLDTEGNWTLGVGFNLTARGWAEWEHLTGHPAEQLKVTHADAMTVLQADIVRVEAAVRARFPLEYDALNEVRQRVAVDLAFNIGSRALGFKKCIAATIKKDWSTAAQELHKAHWALQVEPSVDLAADAAAIRNGKIRGRADRLAKMLLTGQDYVS